MSVAASFWEEHCCECAMPACYAACALFARGWHGRCVRLDGFEETVRGTGTFRFRRWGKLEMVFHGTFVSEAAAARLERLNLLLRPAWRLLGAYHRALRWRLAAACGRPGAPACWRLRARAAAETRLVASVTAPDGAELFRAALALPVGVERAFVCALPSVPRGALFRLFPQDGGATGEIALLENAVSPAAAPAPGGPLKCVAWDLDGTLWDGTLAEGEAVTLRAEAVAAIRALDARGIVNSVVSRNDPAAALAQLRAFGIEELFVFPQIGWGAKSAALRQLAAELNVGLDALGFVDDRAEQRAEVRANAPGVRVYDAAEAAALPARRECAVPVSAESAARRASYRAEAARRAACAASFAGDAEAFLAASGFAYELLDVTETRRARVLELLNRTNQLNISARRYDAPGLAALLAGAEAKAVRAWDRYGDYGTVGFVAWRGTHLLECCFSCRVARKGIERRVLADLFGAGPVTADAVPTARNAPMLAILQPFTQGKTTP